MDGLAWACKTAVAAAQARVKARVWRTWLDFVQVMIQRLFFFRVCKRADAWLVANTSCEGVHTCWSFRRARSRALAYCSVVAALGRGLTLCVVFENALSLSSLVLWWLNPMCGLLLRRLLTFSGSRKARTRYFRASAARRGAAMARVSPPTWTTTVERLVQNRSS